jgi:hypothetical protein
MISPSELPSKEIGRKWDAAATIKGKFMNGKQVME